MIELTPQDTPPTDYIIREQRGDSVRYYFRGDAEVISMDQQNEQERHQLRRALAKQTRAVTINALTITTATGKAFDANVASRDAIVAQVVSMDAGDTTMWTLADNSVAQVTKAELKDALGLIIAEHTRLRGQNDQA